MLTLHAALLTPSVSLRLARLYSYEQSEQRSFHPPYTLPSSVSPKSCVCHSYETGLCFQTIPHSLRKTTRGGYPQHSRGELNASQATHPDYLLMSSFASSRFSNGWRNGFVASGAPLIACVISLAAVGKSPEFDEMRASARWLIQ